MRLASPAPSLLLLRLGLAAVFVDFGLDKLREPATWVMFVPASLGRHLAETPGILRVLETQGLLELMLGIHLAAGLLTRPMAAISAALLAAIIAVVGWTPIGVRDVGLLGAALAIAIHGAGEWSLDAQWHRVRAGMRFPTVAWSAMSAVALVVYLLRPAPAGHDGESQSYRTQVSGPLQPIPAVSVHEPRVQLGQMLFHDARLSGSQTVSCASCHSADFFGADGRVVSLGADGNLTQRNSPTVFNSAHNFRQFWDGRARTLEDQIDGPMLSEHEMASTWDTVIERLSEDARYRRMFAAIYGDGITPDNVKNAIAEFERSLTTPNSPFDRFLLGDGGALSAAALRGYDRFRTLGCVSCHHGVMVGGNSFQTMGKMSDYFADHGRGKDADLGRFHVTGDPRDRHVFKVPALRNVAETGPYFHDGSVSTLPDAVRLMARYQLGYDLSDSQVKDLVAFLESLTGEAPRM